MLNDFPRIPSNVPKSRHRLIHMARGDIVIFRLAIKRREDLIEWLINDIDLPAASEAAIDDGEDEVATVAFQRPDVIAELEAWLDRQDGGSSK